MAEFEDYNSIWEGEEIDDAIAKIRNTGGSGTDAITLGQVGGANPKLMHNPFFRVAQAGYGGWHGSFPYAADRWRMWNGGESLACEGIPGGGIRLTSTGPYPYIEQIWSGEILDGIKGETITVSANIKALSLVDGPAQILVFVDGAVLAAKDITNAGIHSITLTIPETASSVVFMLYVNYANRATGSVVDLYEYTFELGDKSTAENDVPEDIATDLATCQRYFYKVVGYGGSSHHLFSFNSNTLTTLGCLFPATMRTNPAITITSLRTFMDNIAVEATFGPIVANNYGIEYVISLTALSPNNYYNIDFEASADL